MAHSLGNLLETALLNWDTWVFFCSLQSYCPSAFTPLIHAAWNGQAEPLDGLQKPRADGKQSESLSHQLVKDVKPEGQNELHLQLFEVGRPKEMELNPILSSLQVGGKKCLEVHPKLVPLEDLWVAHSYWCKTSDLSLSTGQTSRCDSWQISALFCPTPSSWPALSLSTQTRLDFITRVSFSLVLSFLESQGQDSSSQLLTQTGRLLTVGNSLLYTDPPVLLRPAGSRI